MDKKKSCFGCCHFLSRHDRKECQTCKKDNLEQFVSASDPRKAKNEHKTFWMNLINQR